MYVYLEERGIIMKDFVKEFEEVIIVEDKKK